MLEHVAQTATEKSLRTSTLVLIVEAQRQTNGTRERVAMGSQGPRGTAGVTKQSIGTSQGRRHIVRPLSSSSTLVLSKSSPTIISKRKPAKGRRLELASETVSV